MSAAAYQIPTSIAIAIDELTGYRSAQLPTGEVVYLSPPTAINPQLDPLVFAGAM